MHIVVRFLSGLVFLLALFVGAFLFFHISELPEQGIQQSTRTTAGQIMQTSPLFSLSRLALFPWRPKTREFVAVMIENHQAARPHQAGMEKAVLVQEYFVEGFISRFVALFDTHDLPESIGPVRSLRPYFIQAFLPWTSIVIHSGGSPEALERVERHNDVQNFNAIYMEEKYFTRDHEVPAPHNLFISSDAVHELLASADAKYHKSMQIPLYTVGSAPNGSGAIVISVNFYSPQHDIVYTYQTWKRNYTRMNGRTMSLATPANLVFVEMPVEVVGPYGRLAIDSLGSGRALLFRSGKLYVGSWSRASEDDPFIFNDDRGKPMRFAPGQIWITSLNDLGRVEWKDE